MPQISVAKHLAKQDMALSFCCFLIIAACFSYDDMCCSCKSSLSECESPAELHTLSAQLFRPEKEAGGRLCKCPVLDQVAVATRVAATRRTESHFRN